jgi:hypothetical protein
MRRARERAEWDRWSFLFALICSLGSGRNYDPQMFNPYAQQSQRTITVAELANLLKTQNGERKQD